MSASDWFDGKTATPPLVSLKGRYDGGEADEIPAEAAKASKEPLKPSSPTKLAPEEKKPFKPAAEPVVPKEALAPKVELKDNKQAMADMANKFADKEDDAASSSGDSSFEEVPKPVERYRGTGGTTTRTAAAPIATKPTPSAAASTPIAATRSLPQSSSTPTPTASTPVPSTAAIPAATSSTTTAGPTEGLKSHLGDIKSSQVSMASEISELKSQVGELTDLVKQLAGRLDSIAGGQAEKIRRIELELEELRE